jgi:hypothetical protein
VYFEELERFLHDLWVRTGGGTDTVESAAIEEKYPWPTAQLTSEAKEFQYPLILPSAEQVFNTVTVTGSYTAMPYDFINAKSNAQITFPAYPEENSVIIIRNGDGSKITLSGNGRNINGSATGVLRRESTSIEFYYFIESNEWFAK